MIHDRRTAPDSVLSRIDQLLRATCLGAELNAAGSTTISLDCGGQLIEHRPDGTSRPLERDRPTS